MSKKQVKAILEDEEFIDLQVELIDKIVKKLEEKGYSTEQAIKLATSAQSWYEKFFEKQDRERPIVFMEISSEHRSVMETSQENR